MKLIQIRKATSLTDTAIITLPKPCLKNSKCKIGDYLKITSTDNEIKLEKVKE